MAASPPETPRALLTAWPERVGLPAQLLNGLPAIVGVFAMEGHPAFGVAVLAALSGSQRSVARMRAYEGALTEALRDLGFRMDLTRVAPANVDHTAEQVRLLQGTLTPPQIDQLGRLFEELMRSTDAEWHDMLLRAVRAVVKDGVEEVTRHTILAQLSWLGPAPLRELQRLKDRPTRTRPDKRVREATPAQVVLLTVGFIREGGADAHEGPVNVAMVRVPAAESQLHGEYRLTSVGLAALRLFGPIDLSNTPG